MRRTQLISRVPLLAAALAIALSACKDKVTGPPAANAISVVGASTFTSVVGDVQTVKVLVTDNSSAPLANVTVGFNVVDGGGTIAPTSAITSAAGEASATWTLGASIGLQRAQAQVGGVSSVVTFVATTAAAAPSAIAVSTGDNQSAAAGTALATQPAVIVRDRFNNPVANVSVFFTVTAGGGSVASSGATTNAAGIASANGWRLGPSAGVNRLTALAIVNGVTGNPIVFTANGTAGAALTLSANSITSFAATAGTNVAPLPSVRIIDAGGNPVAGSQVTFQGSSGSIVAGAIKLTDANGVATVDSWLLGTVAQNYTLTASSGALTPVVFTSVARAGTPAIVAANAGNGQSAGTGRPVAIEPSVKVTDGFGNPVVGVEVVFQVISGGGVAVARRPITNAAGIAEVGGWTLGDAVGLNTLRATVTSNATITNNPVTFTATATPGAPASISVAAGTGQSGTINTTLAIAPAVVVRDSRGNAVSDVVVSFLIGSGGGTLTGANATTDNSGLARVGSWTLGPASGTQTVIARIFGLPDVVFSATALGGIPASVVAVSLADLGTFATGGLATPLPSVRVLDATGTPVSAATVTFTPDVGQASVLTGAVQITDVNGVATLGSWNVGAAAGATLRVRAFVTGLNLAGNEPVFVARTTAGAGTTMTLALGAVQSQNAVASTQVGTLPAVLISDANGNPVVGSTVQFAASFGNGTVFGSVVQTNAQGIARVGGWLMPAVTGTYRLTAILGTNTAISYNFTAIVP